MVDSSASKPATKKGDEKTEILSKRVDLVWIVGSTGILSVGNTFATGRVHEIESPTGRRKPQIADRVIVSLSENSADGSLDPEVPVKPQVLPLKLLTSRAPAEFPQPLLHPLSS